MWTRMRKAILTWISRHRSRGRVFISFASSDREIARGIAVALRNQNFKVFLDESDLPAGSDFNTRIEAAMESSDAVVFLLSAAFLDEGRYTHAELGLAEKRWPAPEGRVLAVEVSPVDLTALPAYLSPVSVLRPRGPVATEVTFAVKTMRKWATTRRLAMATSLSLAILAGVLAWFVSDVLEQREFAIARADVLAEMRSNAEVVADLKGNASSLASAVQTVAGSVRNPKIEILAMLFPSANLRPDALEKQTNLYNEVIDALDNSGLVQDPLQRQRVTQACNAIARTIARTRTTIVSLADLKVNRYQISSDRWQLHRPVLVASDLDWSTEMSDLHDAMHSLRRDYARVAAAAVEYLDAMHAFCGELKINRSTMSEVLAAERLTISLLLKYQEEATQTLEQITPNLNDILKMTEPAD
ncbi:MAG: toll/interleukin-1 receptor domain-containing protein [Phyllobacteriaceae bacterium]|jgi:hypothetical protein|nr:toll/interleukin-1 receptor domain-containing protein [Phyllobacteriaceae bacterium]